MLRPVEARILNLPPGYSDGMELVLLSREILLALELTDISLISLSEDLADVLSLLHLCPA